MNKKLCLRMISNCKLNFFPFLRDGFSRRYSLISVSSHCVFINSKANHTVRKKGKIHNNKEYLYFHRFFSISNSSKHSQQLPPTITPYLKELVDNEFSKENIILNQSQIKLLETLSNLQIRLQSPSSPSSNPSSPTSFFSSFFSSSPPPTTTQSNTIQGLYIHGGVGQGKTMLMNAFYHSLPITSKVRYHFHEFMQMIHKELSILKSKRVDDPLYIIGASIASKYRVICLDEFQVIHITDAMILKRLFEGIFNNGSILITTSNRVPNDLYKNGLNRDRFLPFISLLMDQCDVFYLTSNGIDYRLSMLLSNLSHCYYSPSRTFNDILSHAIYLANGHTISTNTNTNTNNTNDNTTSITGNTTTSIIGTTTTSTTGTTTTNTADTNDTSTTNDTNESTSNKKGSTTNNKKDDTTSIKKDTANHSSNIIKQGKELDKSIVELNSAIDVNISREIIISGRIKDIGIIDFNTICNNNTGTSDYIAISNTLHTVFLYNIPLLTQDNNIGNDTIRRFINLIDVLYEKHVRVIYDAAISPIRLFGEAPVVMMIERLFEAMKAYGESKGMDLEAVIEKVIGGKKEITREEWKDAIRNSGVFSKNLFTENESQILFNILSIDKQQNIKKQNLG